MLRELDKGLLVNKLQDAIQEIARNIDDTAIEYLEAELRGDTGIDISGPPAEDKIELVEVMAVDEYDVNGEENQEIVAEKIEVVENIAIQDENDLDDISSEAIRYNSQGESIENPSAQKVKTVACKEEKKLEIKSQEQENVVAVDDADNSSIDEHGQRLWDEHGNSLEQSNESSSEEEEVVVKKPEKTKKDAIRDGLNKKVGEMKDKQLNMRHMDSDESAFNDDDDVPLITIPMGEFEL